MFDKLYLINQCRALFGQRPSSSRSLLFPCNMPAQCMSSSFATVNCARNTSRSQKSVGRMFYAIFPGWMRCTNADAATKARCRWWRLGCTKCILFVELMLLGSNLSHNYIYEFVLVLAIYELMCTYAPCSRLLWIFSSLIAKFTVLICVDALCIEHTRASSVALYTGGGDLSQWFNDLPPWRLIFLFCWGAPCVHLWGNLRQ